MNDMLNDMPLPPQPPPTPAIPPPAPRRSTKGHWIAIVILLLLLGVSVMLNLGLAIAAVAGMATTTVTDGDTTVRFSEEFIRGSGRKKVVKIELNGIITFQGESSMFFESDSVATRMLQEIEAARKDRNVIALLVVVDSPGGGVTASDVIYHALLRFRESDKKRKVVVLMRDLAASGGYYISAAADKIVAHRTTITGSIGVLISSMNFKGLGDKFGVKDVTIKSGKNKDLLNPLRDVTAEETNILQQVVNDMYDRFVSIVARGRGIDSDKVRAFADGRIFTAPKALELQLIDQIGYEEDAIELVRTLVGDERFRLIRYKKSHSLYDLFGARAGASLRLPLPDRWQARWPAVQYLWQPEL
jgi:protease-4